MARFKLTHIGLFFQEFSHPIPVLKELMVCAALAQQTIKVIFVTSDGGRTGKYSIMIKDKVLPPHPCHFLDIF